MMSTNLSSDRSVGARSARALVRENLRRYWIMALVAGLGYFLVMVLPILLNYRSFDIIAGYVEATLDGENAFVLSIDVVLAVVASVCLQSYLHRTDACIAVHSMPADRNQLFGATMVSGVILMLLPMVVAAVLMLACQGAAAAPEAPDAVNVFQSYNSEVRESGADVITLWACSRWLVKNLIVCCFTFVVSALAGVLAGTRVIHALTALFLNWLPAIVIAMSYVYRSTFLNGYSESHSRVFELLSQSSPVIYCGSGGTVLGSTVVGYVGFVLAGILIAVLTLLIYRRLRLEREGDATVFPLMGDFLCMAVSFVCMSGFSFLAAVLSTAEDFNRMFLTYAVVSGLVAFLVFRMVADSTTRVVNLRNLGKLAVFAALVALVFVFTVFDVQGYGKLVPATADVEKVEVSQNELFLETAEFADAEQIDAVREMHRLAMDRKVNLNDDPYNLVITYRLKSGKTVVREYDVSAKALAPLEPLRRSKPFLQAQLYHMNGAGKALKLNGAFPEVSMGDPEEEEEQKLKREDIPAVIQALNQDMAGMEFKYMLREVSEEDQFYLSVYLDDKVKNREYDSDRQRDYFINKHWPATAKVLKDLGYMDKEKKSKG